MPAVKINSVLSLFLIFFSTINFSTTIRSDNSRFVLDLSTEAKSGLDWLMNRANYVSWYFLMTEKEFNDLPFMWEEGPSGYKNRYGLIPSHEFSSSNNSFGVSKQNPELPLGFRSVKKSISTTRVEGSCLICHSSAYPTFSKGGDKIVWNSFPGMGNRDLDFQNLLDDRYELHQEEGYRRDLLGLKSLPLANLLTLPTLALGLDNKWYSNIFPQLYETFENMNVKIDLGTGLISPWAAEALFLNVRNRQLKIKPAKTLAAFLAPKPEHFFHVNPSIALDTPAWFTTAIKSRLYYDGWAPKAAKTIVQSMAAPFNNVKAQLPYMENVMAYINELKAPKFPGDILLASDPKILQGHKIFQKNCAGCHGEHNIQGQLDESTYPNKVVPLNVIGTDRVRLEEGVTREFREDFSESWLGEYGKAKVNLSPRGYVAPPLVGIWSTAPYFHNGSVPTVRKILDYSNRNREQSWMRIRGDYDFENLGFKYRRVSKLEYTVMSKFDKRLVYRTADHSKSNMGHNFPKQGLSEVEKDALIEFLKSF